MNKDILEKIQEQFDEFPRRINLYIINNFNASFTNYIKNNTVRPLANFHVTTHERWKQAEKEYNTDCLYELPKEIFEKIDKQNQIDFIQTWNNVLKFIWNNSVFYGSQNKRNYFFLLIRTHLTQNYGYFHTVDTNKLFRVNS